VSICLILSRIYIIVPHVALLARRVGHNHDDVIDISKSPSSPTRERLNRIPLRGPLNTQNPDPSPLNTPKSPNPPPQSGPSNPVHPLSESERKRKNRNFKMMDGKLVEKDVWKRE
jgi:hypothetical protein